MPLEHLTSAPGIPTDPLMFVLLELIMRSTDDSTIILQAMHLLASVVRYTSCKQLALTAGNDIRKAAAAPAVAAEAAGSSPAGGDGGGDGYSAVPVVNGSGLSAGAAGGDAVGGGGGHPAVPVANASGLSTVAAGAAGGDLAWGAVLPLVGALVTCSKVFRTAGWGLPALSSATALMMRVVQHVLVLVEAMGVMSNLDSDSIIITTTSSSSRSSSAGGSGGSGSMGSLGGISGSSGSSGSGSSSSGSSGSGSSGSSSSSGGSGSWKGLLGGGVGLGSSSSSSKAGGAAVRPTVKWRDLGDWSNKSGGLLAAIDHTNSSSSQEKRQEEAEGVGGMFRSRTDRVAIMHVPAKSIGEGEQAGQAQSAEQGGHGQGGSLSEQQQQQGSEGSLVKGRTRLKAVRKGGAAQQQQKLQQDEGKELHGPGSEASQGEQGDGQQQQLEECREAGFSNDQGTGNTAVQEKKEKEQQQAPLEQQQQVQSRQQEPQQQQPQQQQQVQSRQREQHQQQQQDQQEQSWIGDPLQQPQLKRRRQSDDDKEAVALSKEHRAWRKVVLHDMKEHQKPVGDPLPLQLSNLLWAALHVVYGVNRLHWGAARLAAHREANLEAWKQFSATAPCSCPFDSMLLAAFVGEAMAAAAAAGGDTEDVAAAVLSAREAAGEGGDGRDERSRTVVKAAEAAAVAGGAVRKSVPCEGSMSSTAAVAVAAVEAAVKVVSSGVSGSADGGGGSEGGPAEAASGVIGTGMVEREEADSEGGQEAKGEGEQAGVTAAERVTEAAEGGEGGVKKVGNDGNTTGGSSSSSTSDSDSSKKSNPLAVTPEMRVQARRAADDLRDSVTTYGSNCVLILEALKEVLPGTDAPEPALVAATAGYWVEHLDAAKRPAATSPNTLLTQVYDQLIRMHSNHKGWFPAECAMFMMLSGDVGKGLRTGLLTTMGREVTQHMPACFACNNVGCLSVEGPSEIGMVAGRGGVVGKGVCGGCKQVWYCSDKCQEQCWEYHKPACLKMKKEEKKKRRELGREQKSKQQQQEEAKVKQQQKMMLNDQQQQEEEEEGELERSTSQQQQQVEHEQSELQQQQQEVGL